MSMFWKTIKTIEMFIVIRTCLPSSLKNELPSEESSQPSDHLEMLEGILDCLFLLRRTIRNSSL